MKLKATNVTQTANKDLGTEEKTLYYLIIENDKGDDRVIISVGKKTHDNVKKLIEKPK